LREHKFTYLFTYLLTYFLTDSLDVSRPLSLTNSQLLVQLVLLNTGFVLVNDFSAPGDIAGQMHRHVAEVFTQYASHQRVSVPTHVAGNVLDLVVSQDCEPTTAPSVYTSSAVGLLLPSPSPSDLPSGRTVDATSDDDI